MPVGITPIPQRTAVGGPHPLPPLQMSKIKTFEATTILYFLLNFIDIHPVLIQGGHSLPHNQ